MNAQYRPTQLRTVGVVAELLNVPVHRVEYVLRTRPFILPLAVAGRARLFGNDAIVMIRRELASIDAERGGRRGQAEEVRRTRCARLRSRDDRPSSSPRC